MLVRVPSRLRIRDRVGVDARDRLVEPHAGRKTAIVLLVPAATSGVVVCVHSPTLAPAAEEFRTVTRCPARTLAATSGRRDVDATRWVGE